MKETIQKYCVPNGVPRSNIKALMQELNLNEDKFYEVMRGQTCALIGGETVYYSCDIERFCKGLKVID